MTSKAPTAPLRRPMTELIDRQMPFDLQAEIGVLGSIVLMSDVLNDLVTIIRPEDFYDDAHRKLFTHMCALHESGKKFDDTLLVNRLRTAGDYEAIGGGAYLSKIVNAVPHGAHAIYYAEIVREKAAFRSLIYAATETLRDAYEEAKPAAEISAGLVDRLVTGAQHAETVRPRLIEEVCQQVVNEFRARIGRPEPPAISSGLEAASRAGFLISVGELLVLAARPGGGKTAFLSQVALHNAKQGQTVLFVSLEMKAESVVKRQLFAAAGINGHSVRKCGADRTTVDDLERAIANFAGLPLIVWDPGRIDVGAIRSMACRVKRDHGLRLLIIDYTSWVVPDDPREQRREQVGQIVKGLRSIGQQLEVPVLLAHQLSRDSEKEKPRLSHLRESGTVEEDADVVCFLDPVEVVAGSPQLINLIVAKNRHGAKGETRLRWFPETTQFLDPEEF